jgi:uncharacterized protein YecE (DUF72 family)
MAEIRIGTSGWVYPPWRGVFYPEGLGQRRELDYLSRRVNAVEVNGSFYSLQRPESYLRWAEQTPDDFVFAVKGGRFITHMKQLRGVEVPLANFFASGPLALDHKLGPILWQLPPRMTFDPKQLQEFFTLLPRTTGEASTLAEKHDGKLRAEAWTKPGGRRAIRYALEVRHPSFTSKDFVKLLRDNDIALVVADTAGKWPYLDEATSELVYVRLHGDKELYASGYEDAALDAWAEKIRRWHDKAHKDVYVFFDNDIKVKAPTDAMALAAKLGVDLTLSARP